MLAHVLALAGTLAAVHLLLASKIRREEKARRRLPDADEMTPDEVDFWLGLIEPFPLRDPSRKE